MQRVRARGLCRRFYTLTAVVLGIQPVINPSVAGTRSAPAAVLAIWHDSPIAREHIEATDMIEAIGAAAATT